MNSKERIKAILGFRDVDRIGIRDAPWPETVERWRKEGLPEGISVEDYFGFDFDLIHMDASLRWPEKNLEVTKEYLVRQDKHGCIIKAWLKSWHGLGGYGMAVLDNVIKTRQDWEKHKGRLTVDFGGTSRIGIESYAAWWDSEICNRYLSWSEEKERINRLRKRQKYLLINVYGPFEATWRKHGWMRTIRNMIRSPEFIHDMFDVHTSLVIDTLKRGFKEGIKPDGLFLVEDMAYRHGPFFSPRAYKELLLPFHKRIGDFLKAKGMGYFVHTDGDIQPLIPYLIEGGFDVLQPLQADLMDVRSLKKEYNCKMVFMGNINARRMSGSKKEIEKEVKSKILVAKQGGGYIYHSDHSVPYNVSFENYKYVLELVKEYGKY